MRNATLVLLLLATSMPFIQAIGHAQNTCTSLLLLSVVVALWRAERSVWAGVACGLLFYKPQLAAVVAGVMALDLGVPAIAGLALSGLTLLAITAVALPGSLGDWLHNLPANVRYMQVEHPYLWDRHVTIKSFWRLLLQGTAAGEASAWTTVWTALTWTAVAGPLVWVAILARGESRRPRRHKGGHEAHEGSATGVRRDTSHPSAFVSPFVPSWSPSSIFRDRLIAATVCAMPLLMPFYFDYDLLLLAVPATLYAADRHRDRPLTAGWVVLFAWMFVNAPLASRFHVAGAVAILAVVTGLSIRRAARPGSTGARPLPLLLPLAAAA